MADATPASPGPAGDGKPALPPITAGQRASAILGGLAGHLLFSIGWFGIAFIILGAPLSGLVNDLLRNLLGDVDAAQLTAIVQRAGALLWMLGLVFLVGSAAFIVFGILVAQLILRRGGVDKAGRVNVLSFVIAAIVDLPVFLFTLWLATLVTDNASGAVFLPPLIALVIAAAVGVLVWWWMAHVNRGPSAPKAPRGGRAPTSPTASPTP